MTKIVDLPQLVNDRRLTHWIEDDFNHLVTADQWTLTTDVDGTATVQDQVGGVVDIVSAVTTPADNEETNISSTAEIFLFAADKPLEAVFIMQFAQAATNAANLFLGVSSVVDGTLLGDDGAGPPSTWDGVGFFLVDGATTWSVESSFATTQTTTNLDGTSTLNNQTVAAQTAGSTSFQELKFYCQPLANSVMDVDFFIDGVLVAKHKDVAMTTPEEMHVVFSVAQGSATVETLSLDYVYVGQTR